MNILIVAGTFPPYSPSSASRANKFAKFLVEKGHDVKVLAPNIPYERTFLTPEIDQERIIFTDYYDINNFPPDLMGKIKGIFSSKDKKDNEQPKIIKTEGNFDDLKESKLSILYRKLTNIPDKIVGWYPFAVKAGRSLFKEWSPDIIFSTAPPYSSFLVARKLSKINKTPWIADFRDLWIDEKAQRSVIRDQINRLMEKFMLSNCNGAISVTESGKKFLEKEYNMPIRVARNGYDPADFNPKKKNVLYPDHLTIIYAGILYSGKRDPSKLFEAMGKIGKKAKDIKILFYTPCGEDDISESQKAIIEKNNLQENVIFNRFIPQKELLNIQLGTDVMLLLRWDNIQEDGVIAGKLFEYIGAKKPILSIGSITGEAAGIIRNNDLGVISNDVDEIAAYLEKCLKDKKDGKSFEQSHKNGEKFVRSIQFEKIENFMEEIVQDYK